MWVTKRNVDGRDDIVIEYLNRTEFSKLLT